MKRRKTGPMAWHVFTRGARRLELFREAEDFQEFLKILRISLSYSKCLLWAFALIANHYHLILYGTSAQLSRCMKRLNLWYSTYHNRKYGLSGHAFDGPYRAYPQTSLYLLLRKIAYVLLNPFRAGFGKTPEAYPWTNIAAYVGRGFAPLPADIAPVLERIDPDPRKAQDRFREVLEEELRAPKRSGGDTLSALEVQQQQFEWLLERAKALHPDRPDAEIQDAAIYWASQAGVRPKAMALSLNESDTNRIRQRLWLLKQRTKTDPDFARALGAP